MLRLLSIEWQKIWTDTSFRVMMIVYTLLVPFIHYNLGSSSVNFNGMEMGLGTILSFPSVWEYSVYFASFLHYLLGFVIISNITREFTLQTVRQQVMDGLSRLEIVGSKWLFILVLGLWALFLVVISSLLLGFIYSESYSPLIESPLVLFTFFLQAIGYMSIAALIAFLVQRSGLSYILFLGGALLEWVFGGLVDRFILQPLGQTFSMGDFLPFGIIGNLVPRPFKDQLSNIGINLADPNLMGFGAATALIIGILFYLAYTRFNRMDL